MQAHGLAGVDSAPPYHAISYTWGDPGLTARVTVKGRRMEVRQNCEYVLRQACWHGGGGGGGSTSRSYWVDAICIDQGNLEEKGRQVAMMGGIYQAGSRRAGLRRRPRR